MIPDSIRTWLASYLSRIGRSCLAMATNVEMQRDLAAGTGANIWLILLGLKPDRMYQYTVLPPLVAAKLGLIPLNRPRAKRLKSTNASA